MELKRAIAIAQDRICKNREFCEGQPEEQTKISLILPWIHEVLGVPQDAYHLKAEYGDGPSQEKVDLAVQSDDAVTLLIECKPISSIGSTMPHMEQLRRYFGFGGCHVICLTDGDVFHFWTDICTPGEMDEFPCLSLRMSSLSEGDERTLAYLRLYALDATSLHDAIADGTRERVMRTAIISHAEKALEAVGFHIGCGREENLVRCLKKILGDGEPNVEESKHEMSQSAEPKTIEEATSTLQPIPMDMNLDEGILYEIRRTTGQPPYSYDGFLWIPPESENDFGCYILPGTRIRHELNKRFSKVRNKKTLLRRQLIELNGGTLSRVMMVETPSGAGRLITGIDMRFKQIPKRRITAQDYYLRFPEAYNPKRRCTDGASGNAS